MLCPFKREVQGLLTLGIDSIEYDVTAQISALQHGNRGRPKARWTDNIRALNGGSLYGLRKTALDRDAWKEFTSRITTGQLTP